MKSLIFKHFCGIVVTSLTLGCGIHESRSLAEEEKVQTDKVSELSPEQAFFVEIQSGDLNAVEKRILSGTSVDVRLEHQRTPLMVAALWRQIPIARFLLEQGAATDLVDKDGKDVWSFAEGNADFVRLLPSRISQEKIEEVFALVKAGNYRGLKAELDAGLDPNLRDRDGRTLLIAAVHARKPAVVATLARYPGIDLNLRDADGLSARQTAEALGEQQILRELVARGAI